jgi:hypothetical protein
MSGSLGSIPWGGHRSNSLITNVTTPVRSLCSLLRADYSGPIGSGGR